MLETLVNVDVLVYNLFTSNNRQLETISRKDPERNRRKSSQAIRQSPM